MDLLHSGFDGLDLAYRASIPKSLASKLKQIKELAAKVKIDQTYVHEGLELQVAQTGSQGGYAYQCNTGELGAILCFKEPNPNDPWGVRVSLRALALATMGLDGAKAYIEDILHRLGIALSPQAESIARVDLAFDYLAPRFVLNQNQFVMHARSGRKTHFEADTIREFGRSGRVTSVTIGKNPGQQVIVYDKRDEVLSRGKVAWPTIWAAQRRAQGLPALDLTDASSSRVWRVELRAHKKHLKDTCGISTWHELSEHAPAMFAKMLEKIRYCQPTADSNRARWPEHRLWQSVHRDLDTALQSLPAMAAPEAIRHALVEQRDRSLTDQIDGCMVSLMALRGATLDELSTKIEQEADSMRQRLREDPKRAKTRLERARGKYAGLRVAERDPASDARSL